MSEALQLEVVNGYMIGPLDKLPYSTYRVSPLGVAQSKYSGKKRLILDLSSPHDKDTNSINSLIDKEKYSLDYVKVDDAIDIIRRLGKGTLLTKVDVKDAFRILPILPSQWRYHCVKWEGKYYVFVRLVFGSRSSPKSLLN